MDWIERFLHIDPDHGSGFVEAVIGVAAITAVVAWRYVRSLRRSGSPELDRPPEETPPLDHPADP